MSEFLEEVMPSRTLTGKWVAGWKAAMSRAGSWNLQWLIRFLSISITCIMEKWRFVGPQSYAISALLRSTRAGFQTVSREGTIYGNTYIYIYCSLGYCKGCTLHQRDWFIQIITRTQTAPTATSPETTAYSRATKAQRWWVNPLWNLAIPGPARVLNLETHIIDCSVPPGLVYLVFVCWLVETLSPRAWKHLDGNSGFRTVSFKVRTLKNTRFITWSVGTCSLMHTFVKKGRVRHMIRRVRCQY